MNKIHELLIQLGISTAASVEPFFPRVRDREDIAVLRCKKSGVLFLSHTDQGKVEDYMSRQDLSYWSLGTEGSISSVISDDDRRRANQLRGLIQGKSWTDIGAGQGGLLLLLKDDAQKVQGIEPQAGARERLKKLHLEILPKIEELKDGSQDVITLYHVLEHFPDPLNELMKISSKLKSKGRLVVEVPHAEDALLSLFDLKDFKDFTFWSEHILLHTRDSLKRLLEFVGFRNVAIQGYQRYPLSNHLHWLSKGKPGGHEKWNFLDSPELTSAYGNALAQLGKTDTLIAYAEKA